MTWKTTVALATVALFNSSVALAQPEGEDPPADVERATPYVESLEVPRVAPAPAPAPRAAAPMVKKKRKKHARTWEESARFFVGTRGGVAVPNGGDGIAPTAGLELGVAADSGLGIGLHLIWMNNPPDVPSFGIPKAVWGVGAMADFRWYFQTVRPLTLYPTFSVGFAAGPGRLDGKNVVLPMLNPGFGARVRLGQIYVAFEFGAASFHIPFINFALGWEPPRMPDPEEEEA